MWLALLGLGLWLAPGLARVAVTDPIRFFPADAANRVAARAFDAVFPGVAAASQVVIVLEAESGALTEAEPQARIARLARRLREAFPPGAGSRVDAPTDDPVLAERLTSRDSRAALLVLSLRAGFASEEASGVVARVETLVAEELAHSGLRARFSGHATLGRDYLAAIESGAKRSALATVALVSLTLLLVHRAPLAALASLATLAAALAVASGAVTLAGELGLPVAFQSRGFLVAIVYGVGTDYCLLLFARVREEGDLSRARHVSRPVIVTSALAVALACSLMGLARFGLFAYSGPALAIGVLVTLAAVLTLAPALMTLAGDKLFWPRKPGAPARSRIWQAIAQLVLARPELVLIAPLALLVPLALVGSHAAPSFELELDIPAHSASEAGWAALVHHFDPAEVAPLTLAIALPGDSAGLRSTAGLDGLYQVTEWLASQPGVARVWSATRPTGQPDLLARATLRSQLGELASGLGRARDGAAKLGHGLGRARHQVESGRSELDRKQTEIAAEQGQSLLGAFAPGRFEDARRDLAASDAHLAQLAGGLGEAAAGAEQLEEGIALGRDRLAQILAAPGATRLLDRLVLTPADIEASSDLVRALDHYLSADARGARFELQLASAPSSPAAVETLLRLERELGVLLPALGFPGARVYASGPARITADLASLTRADLDRLDLWIVGGVLALLIALLRSLKAPVAITAFILLSYFAALGALQGLVAAGVWPGLDWKVPFFLFVLLVAIGADYGVFLLGRAREEAAHLAYPAALARALAATGPVVTSCGIVLAGTFATLLLSRIAFLEQVGIGITIGVLIDTGLVRPFLLPAAALLLERSASRAIP